MRPDTQAHVKYSTLLTFFLRLVFSAEMVTHCTASKLKCFDVHILNQPCKYIYIYYMYIHIRTNIRTAVFSALVVPI